MLLKTLTYSGQYVAEELEAGASSTSLCPRGRMENVRMKNHAFSIHHCCQPASSTKVLRPWSSRQTPCRTVRPMFDKVGHGGVPQHFIWPVGKASISQLYHRFDEIRALTNNYTALSNVNTRIFDARPCHSREREPIYGCCQFP